jgi:tetratricopeptide (TPR) repeat protein
MAANIYRFSLPLAALMLLGAISRDDPLDLVRQGNAVFARGEFETALSFYERAEDLTLDPGLVAFNKAVALYQLGRYRDAELHYRRCREDAEGARLPRLLYGLANCLAQQSRGTSLPLLREAIELYLQCLQQEETDSVLRDDARHNLEVARLLWLQAKRSRESSSSAEEDPANDPPREHPQDAQLGNDPYRMATPDVRGRPEPITDPRGDPKAAAKTDERPPGKGNLPPIPDTDELVSLSPEDAAAHLQQALNRIRRERQEHRQQSVPTIAAHVMDW